MEEKFNDDQQQMSGLKKVILSILGLLVLVVATIGISFAIFRVTQTSEANSITSGSISMNYTEAENGIYLENALPIRDEVGMNMSGSREYFDFSVTTTTSGSIVIPYEINISEAPVSSKALDKSNVKVYLTKIVNGNEEIVLAPTNLKNLEESTLRVNAIKLYETSDLHENTDGKITTNYRLRMWVDYEADATLISDSSYKITVNVDAKVSAK